MVGIYISTQSLIFTTAGLDFQFDLLLFIDDLELLAKPVDRRPDQLIGTDTLFDSALDDPAIHANPA